MNSQVCMFMSGAFIKGISSIFIGGGGGGGTDTFIKFVGYLQINK
jgi:hypothetical protein